MNLATAQFAVLATASPSEVIISLWNWRSPLLWASLAGLLLFLWMLWAKGNRRLWPALVAAGALVVAFASPVGVLADGYLFSAHMLQHLILLLIVPMCLLLCLPMHDDERRCAPVVEGRRRSIALLGWIAGLGAMWFWHVPALCSASTQSASLGAVRDASLLAAGLVFWWPIYGPSRSQRLAAPNAVVYLFSACLGCTLLGIYITFTTVSVCPAFANPVDRLRVLNVLYDIGLTPAVDQHWGGLLMWAPPCSLYVCAIISILRRWYATFEPAPALDVTAAANHSEFHA